MRALGLAVLLAGLEHAGVARADLDAPGRVLLEPIRDRALQPAALVERLHLRKGARVADVGAGPGFLTLPLARAVPRGVVIATDVRADYLATTAERARVAGLTNVKTRVVDPHGTGLEPRSLDLIVLCQVDHYLADRESYFAELARALEPDGRVVLVNYARYRDADLRAANALGWKQLDAWAPSPPFFVLVLRP
jgi:ubiquinone/menaquinone biosynthesis C-methylase UbiE